ncbi:MAG: hypothetical protein KKC64_09345 [Spirochaetes bacterium]|nr:hypothetical protein [Spirochaetota bacterium]
MTVVLPAGRPEKSDSLFFLSDNTPAQVYHAMKIIVKLKGKKQAIADLFIK